MVGREGVWGYSPSMQIWGGDPFVFLPLGNTGIPWITRFDIREFPRPPIGMKTLKRGWPELRERKGGGSGLLVKGNPSLTLLELFIIRRA